MGFMVATYMPMGLLSDGAQRFIKLFPGAYVAASCREILMDHYVTSDIPETMRDEFTKFLGIKISINDHLLLARFRCITSGSNCIRGDQSAKI